MKPLQDQILTYIQSEVNASPILATIFMALIFITALGGIFVIMDDLLTFYVPKIGKLWVMLGARLGLFGLMIPMSHAWHQGTPVNEVFKGYVSQTWEYVWASYLR
jgi:hypothetical protein